jgi:hypothetical protein
MQSDLKASHARRTRWRGRWSAVALVSTLSSLLFLGVAGTALAGSFTMVPSGDAVTGFYGAGPHHTLVSDGKDATSVSYDELVWATDSFSVKLPDHLNQGWSIKKVTVSIRVRGQVTDAAYPASARTYLKTGALEKSGTALELSDQAWHELSSTYSANPATGKAWTPADVAALSPGVQLRADQARAYPVYCSEVWVTVDYANPPFLMQPCRDVRKQLATYPAATDHFPLVSDRTTESWVKNWDTTDYRIDLYALTTPWTALPSGAIKSLTVNLTLWRQAHFGPRDEVLRNCARAIIAPGGTETFGPETKALWSIADFKWTWTTNPKSKSAWAWGDLPTLDAGVALRDNIHNTWTGANSGDVRCYELYVLVDYDGEPYDVTAPASLSVPRGSTASFTSTATDPSCTVHWEWSMNGGRSWSDIPTYRYPTAASTTLDLGVVPRFYSGRQFRAVFHGALGNAASDPAALTVTPNPGSAVSTVNALNPSAAVTGQKTTVTITGTHLLGTWAVKFGATAASSFSVLSDTKLTATTPTTLPMGVVDLTVTTPLGTTSTVGAANNFSFLTRYQQDDSRFAFNGTWSNNFVDAAASGGSYAKTSQPAASVTIIFTGTRIDWIALRGPAMGSAAVYVDGVFKKSVSLYAASILYKQPVFSSGTLTNTSHTLRIVRATTADGKLMTIDAVDVLGTL